MKHVVALLAVASLAGCAGMASNDPIHYDTTRDAAVSPGHPIDDFSAPEGFELKDNLRYSERRASDRASDNASIQVSEHLFAWEAPDQDGDLLTLLQLRIDSRSEFFPIPDTDGYEFVGGQKVAYWHEWGRFEDVFFDHTSDPEVQHECARVVHLGMTTPSKRYRTIASLFEGVPCDEGGSWSDGELEDHRQHAYQAFGLN